MMRNNGENCSHKRTHSVIIASFLARWPPCSLNRRRFWCKLVFVLIIPSICDWIIVVVQEKIYVHCYRVFILICAHLCLSTHVLIHYLCSLSRFLNVPRAHSGISNINCPINYQSPTEHYNWQFFSFDAVVLWTSYYTTHASRILEIQVWSDEICINFFKICLVVNWTIRIF